MLIPNITVEKIRQVWQSILANMQVNAKLPSNVLFYNNVIGAIVNLTSKCMVSLIHNI